MQNPQLKRQAILRVMDTLTGDPPYFITSLDNPDKAGGITAGVVFDLPNKLQAAGFIVEATHRPSTLAEIEAFYADQKLRGIQAAKDAMDRKGQLAMPQDLQDLVRLATRQVQHTESTPPAQPAKRPAAPEKEK